MNFRIFIRFLIFISIVILLAACDNWKQDYNRRLIDKAAELMEINHKQTLDLLKDVNIKLLNEEEYAWFTLLQVRAWNLEDMNISTSDAAVLNARDYFIRNNNVEKAVYACFVYAHVYYAEGNMNKALYHFQQAEEWAERVNYKIPYFNYSLIPYNIALIYIIDGKAEEALSYSNKAIKYIDTTNDKYEKELHILELKGAIFKDLGNVDSAFFCFDRALKIAEKHTNKESKARTLYNQSLLFYKIEDYTSAKNNCLQSIEYTPINDSIKLGHLHMRLALIYDKFNQLDSSNINIYMAKDFLQHISINEHQVLLYKALYQLEEKRGNTKKAGEYKELYKHYKKLKTHKPNPEVEQLKEKLKQTQANHISNMIFMQAMHREEVKSLNHQFYIVSALLVIGIICFVYSYKLKRSKKKFETVIYSKEEKYKQEIKEKERKYKELANKKEQQKQDIEQKVINRAIRKALKEHEIIIADWEKKYKEIEKNNRKYFKDLVQWNKERRQTFKMHLQEVSKIIQRIKYLKAIEELLSLEKTGEAHRMLQKIKETTSWSSTWNLLNPCYNSTFEKLKAEFPDLNDKEYAFCCLYVISVFSTTEIMLLLDVNDEQFKTLKSNTSKKLGNVNKNLAYLRNYDKYSQEA